MNEAQIVKKLKELEPIKTHYWWYASREFLERQDNPLLYQLARITHTVCLSMPSCTAVEMDNAVKVCKATGSTIGLNHSPWEHKFAKNLSPISEGPTYWAEIKFMQERFSRAKALLEQANADNNANIKVTALLYDCERFRYIKGYRKWNAAIVKKLNLFHIQGLMYFPDAHIEWWYRGMKQGEARGTGWERTPSWTTKELQSSLSCALYALPEKYRMQEIFRKTCELADELGVEDVTPWIAIGAGSKPTFKRHKWDPLWNYDLIYSWRLGVVLNRPWWANRSWLPPYGRIKRVIIYPGPFLKKYRYFPAHLIAYFRGANYMMKLDDLEGE